LRENHSRSNEILSVACSRQNALKLPEGVVLEGMYLDHQQPREESTRNESTSSSDMATATFRPQIYLEHLKAPTFGHVILTAHRLPSTHSLLSQ
jgi:hypothetical protein